MDSERKTGYTADEVHAIVRRALMMHDPLDTISHEDLEEIATQSGVPLERLHQAIAAEQITRERDEAREYLRRKKRQEFRDHLRSYLIVNGFLVLVNVFTNGYPWCLWVVGGWGVGLAFHACDVFFPNEHETDKAVDRYLRRAKRRSVDTRMPAAAWREAH